MRNYVISVASVAGAAALAGSMLSGAMAARPAPLHPLTKIVAKKKAVKKYKVGGDLEVHGVVRVDKNNSVYGRLYAHGGEQVWHGLLVNTGGIKSDSLNVTGPAQMQSATIAGNLQAGAMTGTSLNMSGPVTLGATLTVGGKVTANGVDAGASGLTTSGTVTAAGVSATSISDSGTLNAGSVTTNGTLTAGSVNSSGTVTAAGAALGNLTATGTVDLSNATLKLPANVFNLNGSSVTSLNVGQTLNVGTVSQSIPPLTVAEGGQTATVGVDTNGNLLTNGIDVKNLVVTGSFTLPGNGALSVSGIAGAPVNGSSGPGPLSLQGTQVTIGGNAITLAANTAISNGADLNLNGAIGGAPQGASHLTASSNSDVAGLVSFNSSSVNPANPTSVLPQTVTFQRPYKNQPIIELTADSDPAPGSTYMPKVWVELLGSTGNYTGFRVYYVPVPNEATSINVIYGYTVIGT